MPKNRDVIRMPGCEPKQYSSGLDTEQARKESIENMQQESRKGNRMATMGLEARAQQLPLQFKLPLWPDHKRGIPEDFACSALFGMVAKGTRVRYDVETQIEAWGDTVMTYMGHQLGQGDLDVYMHILHMFRDQVIEKNRPRIEFSLSEMLKFLKKTRGKKNMDILKQVLSRLQYCQVTLRKQSINKSVFSSSLISNFSFNEVTQRFTVGIHPDTALLFGPAFPQIDMEDRRALKGDFTQWLHAYVVRHKATEEDPHRINIDRLKALSNSSIHTTMAVMRNKIRVAMAQLEELGIVSWWKVADNDVLWFYK